MSNSTNFVSGVTVISAAWANDINTVAFTALGDGSGNRPGTPSQVVANLGISALIASALASSGITITAGTGLSGGGAVTLGSTITLSNSGVVSLTGTSNQITVSASTGAVTLSLPSTINVNTTGTAANITGTYAGTISSTQVTTALGFTPISTLALTGDASSSGSGSSLTLTLATVNSNVGTFGTGSIVPVVTVNAKGLVTAVTTAATVGSLTGTANQITVSASTGAVTLSLPSTINVNTTGTASNITGTYAGTLTSGQVTAALTYTPYNATNPSGYLTTAVTALAGTANQIAVSGSTGAVTLSLPATINVNTTGTASNITGTYAGTISSSQVTTALGFTPTNSYFSSSVSATVASGSTDYGASPPSGYTAGTTNRLILTANSAGSTLLGLGAPSQDGFNLIIFNIGTGNLSFAHRGAGTAANQFNCPGGTTLAVSQYGATRLSYIVGTGWVFA